MNKSRDLRDIPELELKFKPEITHLFLESQKVTIDFLRAIYEDDINIQELFVALFMDADFQLIGYKTISKGSKLYANFDLQLLLSYALLTRADKIIISHNHTLITVSPSDADKKITYEIVKACRAIKTPLVDHIIINQESSYSFLREDNKFNELSLVKNENYDKEI